MNSKSEKKLKSRNDAKPKSENKKERKIKATK